MTPETPRHFCVAGVALGDIHLDFTWQAWHNCTSTVVLRGRRGTNSHPPSFHVAGVAQPHIYRRFAWQAWHLWHWVVRLDLVYFCVAGMALGDIHLDFTWQAWHKFTSTVLSRGRRGTTSHLPSFCVAGVALMALGGALGLGLGARDAAPLLRGRRGTW